MGMNKQDRDKAKKLLSYIGNPLSLTSIELMYNSNNIIYERSDLYKDFVMSLIDLIFNTYMGDAVTSEKDRVNHFKWCWDKTIKNFEAEGVLFGENSDLYDYFLNFMIEIYYSVEDKNEDENIEYNIVKLWKQIFNYQITKTQSDVDTYIEVYEMFDKLLENGFNT